MADKEDGSAALCYICAMPPNGADHSGGTVLSRTPVENYQNDYSPTKAPMGLDLHVRIIPSSAERSVTVHW